MKNITISIRFKGEIPQIETIQYFENILNELFKKQVSKIIYTILDKSSDNWKQKSKELQYSQAAVNKYEEVLKEAGENVFVGFELLKNRGGYQYRFQDIDFAIMMKPATFINSLNLTFDLSENLTIDWRNFVEDLILFLIKKGCEIVYGFVFSLDRQKAPLLYIEGIGNPDLNKEEQKKLNMWANRT